MRLRHFFVTAELIRRDYHTIKYNEQNIDIVCPCYRRADGSEVIVIPWYLIPGRPYPLQVYQFACSYYCANPEISQRGAAEATRIKFKLKTFSHSTISRTFRSLEDAHKASLENRYGEELNISEAESTSVVSAAPKVKVDKKDKSYKTARKTHSVIRFPSVADTLDRRIVMAGFLPKFKEDAKTADIEAAGCQFIKDWHEKSRRLLL